MNSVLHIPYLVHASAIADALHVRPKVGVLRHDVDRRREQYGKNEIPLAHTSRLLILFVERFRDVLVLILVSAAIVSFILNNIEDTVIIAVAIAIDVSLSFLQVWRTEKTLEKMRSHVQDVITVVRDGKPQTIYASHIVVGDILELRAGEKVPADARLVSVQGLHTHEALLTGESSDVRKQSSKLSTRTQLANQSNMVFAGTSVVSGRGTAIVTAVGPQTEFGKIAQVLRDQRSPSTPLRKKLQRNSIHIGWIIIAAVVVFGIIGILQGMPIQLTARTSITLVVSAIPEDLTMILTIALTVGVTRILRHGGVMRRLSSGESLGAATVICTDKTGTLTKGKMTALYFDFLQGDRLLLHSRLHNDLHKLAIIGFNLASDAYKGGVKGDEYFGSATERTALAFAESLGTEQKLLRKQWKTRDAINFHPSWKYRAILVDHPTQSNQFLFVTGAPDILLLKSSHTLNNKGKVISISSRKRNDLATKIERHASGGKRMYAVALRRHLHMSEITHDDIHNLLFLGVLTIQDPVRPDVPKAITETLNAGVDVKVVTGDHAATALAVAKQAGLPANSEMVITGEMLQQMSDEELKERIQSTIIFSRVEPLDKHRLIRILQEQGHVVAMTGDGVNDTVALKSADIGIAMGSGTDIAKDAADLILLNNSFGTIVAAIREGRVMRDNIKKVISFLLATNAAEVAIFFVSLLFRLPLPLLPAQILWINLVTDGTSDIALSLEPAEEDTMKRPPDKPNAPLLGRRITGHIVFSGIIMTVSTMALFWYLLEVVHEELAYAQTMAFTFLAVASLLSVWSFRSLNQAISARGLWKNVWVPISAGFSLALHAVSLYIPAFRSFFHTVPLGITDWLLIVLIAVITILIVDMRKVFFPTTGIAKTPLWNIQSSLLGADNKVKS